jgi:TatD DNase family protein
VAEDRGAKGSKQWIDGHCHLADPRFDTDLDHRLAEARAVGIGVWIQGGVGPEDWERQLQLQARLGAAIVPTFGLHPWWVAGHGEAELEAALALLEARLPRAMGLGELGLDASPHHCPPETLPRQSRAFEAQLAMAKHAHKPLVLHVVRAHPPALEALERLGPFPAGGLVHSFSGSGEIARQYLALGFHLSLGGSVTREGFQTLKKAVGSLPFDRLVLETDAPDQLPQLPGVEPGSLNEPRHLVGIADAVARLRGVSREELLDQSTQNLKRLFRL